MRKPKSSKTGKTMVKKDIVEIGSDSDSDEVNGRRILALCCGEVNALNTIVKKDLVEVIDLDSDTDEASSGDRLLALCGSESCELLETDKTNMQIVCADDDDSGSGLGFDAEYKKYLASFSTNHQYLLEDIARGGSLMLLTYGVVATDETKGRGVKSKKSRVKSPLVSSVSKKLKTENGSRTYFRKEETRKNKGDGRQGSKIALTKKTSARRNIRASKKPKTEKKRAVLQGRKIPLTKNSFKAGKTENKSQMIASKRLKTEKSIPIVKTKEKQRKKREVLRRKIIPVTKNNAQAESTSHFKDNLLHSFKASKKENGVRLSTIDESYECFLASLRNSVTIFELDREVKPVKEAVCLSDPDILAISDYPFSDGGNCIFEATKNGKVVDLEDAIDEPYDIFNSSFSKRLMEILRKPYDEKEYVQLRHDASRKRIMSQTRELRDGREIEYKVDNQLRLSYLEQHPDFNKKFRCCRREKDLSRALNLLRGFIFYLKNVVHEGAFKPWLYEERFKIEHEDKAASRSS